MPHEMFGGVVDPSIKLGSRKWYTVPLSIAVHTLIIAAVIIIFELTGDYQIILPLMFAVALATAGSSLLSADTIYTLKLRRRGIDLSRRHAADTMELLRVQDAMQPVPPSVPSDMPLSEIVERIAATDVADLLVRVGTPFREAHGVVAGLVRTALDSGRTLSQLTPQELESHSAALAEHAAEYLEVLSPGSWLESKVSEGGTSLTRVGQQLALAKTVLDEAPVA